MPVGERIGPALILAIDMLLERIVLGSATLVGALVGGVALGNYTIGGFANGYSAAAASAEVALADPPAGTPPIDAGYGQAPPAMRDEVHVCTGCGPGRRGARWHEDAYLPDQWVPPQEGAEEPAPVDTAVEPPAAALAMNPPAAAPEMSPATPPLPTFIVATAVATVPPMPPRAPAWTSTADP